jgi:hypothetical protein
LLRDVEKETLARMRRSRFGDNDTEGHKLLVSRLVLSEDGRDDYLCAEQYVMLGNWIEILTASSGCARSPASS